jgi:hypothetical protein
MLLSVALFQGFRGLFATFWPLRWIGFSACFGRNLSGLSLPSKALWKLFCEEKYAALDTHKSTGSAYGTRTRAPALRGPCPNRLDERAKLGRQTTTAETELKLDKSHWPLLAACAASKRRMSLKGIVVRMFHCETSETLAFWKPSIIALSRGSNFRISSHMVM